MSVNTKTFLSKCNTIKNNSSVNMGLNPVMEINWNGSVSRGLIYFDHSKLQCLVENKIYPDLSKLRHILKLTNCASINTKKINDKILLMEGEAESKERASSFDLIFFLLPQPFDSGRGYDYSKDLYLTEHSSYSTNGSNWFCSQNHKKWEYPGVYTTEQLSHELDLFTSPNGNMSNIIIGYEHFDYGNESISLDITSTVNKFITGELKNNGIGIAVSPKYEDLNKSESNPIPQYVGFFTNHTHSFYEPYLETTYDDFINDDRQKFYLDKDNKLYFYSIVGNDFVNLDVLPTCSINDTLYDVKQATKGVYYVDINLPSDEYENSTIYYDVWDNIIYKGKKMKPVTMEFLTYDNNGFYKFGNNISGAIKNVELSPSIIGIDFNEKIRRGDTRTIEILCRVPYKNEPSYDIGNIEYRLYVMEGVDEHDVISWSKVEHAYLKNYFLLNTDDLLPCRYYIDVRLTDFNSQKIYHKKLCFDIVNDTSEVFV